MKDIRPGSFQSNMYLLTANYAPDSMLKMEWMMNKTEI